CSAKPDYRKQFPSGRNLASVQSTALHHSGKYIRDEACTKTQAQPKLNGLTSCDAFCVTHSRWKSGVLVLSNIRANRATDGSAEPNDSCVIQNLPFVQCCYQGVRDVTSPAQHRTTRT